MRKASSSGKFFQLNFLRKIALGVELLVLTRELERAELDLLPWFLWLVLVVVFLDFLDGDFGERLVLVGEVTVEDLSLLAAEGRDGDG